MVFFRSLFSIFYPSEFYLKKKLLFSSLSNLLAIIAASSTPLCFKYLIDALEQGRGFRFVLCALSVYVVLWGCEKFFLSLREISLFPVMEKAISKLSFVVYRHLHQLSYDYHVNKKTGELTGIIDMALNHFPQIIWPVVFRFIPLVLEVLFASGVLIYFCGFFYAIILVLTVCLLGIVSYRGFDLVVNNFEEANNIHLKASSQMTDGLLNFMNIKYFMTQKSDQRRVNETLEKRYKINSRAHVKAETFRLQQLLILFISFLVLVLLTGYKVIIGELTLGDFVMVHGYLLHFAIPVEDFADMFRVINIGLTKIKRVTNILNKEVPLKNGNIKIKRNDPLHIVFEDVTFGYDKNKPLLKGVSFDIKPGESIVIMGKTGEGKSTIISLILRFYDVWQGKISINGHDIKDIDPKSLMRNIGVVPQNVSLFNNTIKNNLSFVKNTIVREKEIDRAIAFAALKKTFEKFPKGIYTQVGEQGVKLSGGEKQRLGLARAFLITPSLYLLDEGTSALDYKTEALIIQHIQTQKMKGVSCLAITHRKSLLSIADHVYELREGKLHKVTPPFN